MERGCGKTFGKADALTAAYIGAAGRKLMRQDIYNKPNPNFSGEFDLMSNGADSSYQALQTQFRHRVQPWFAGASFLDVGTLDRRCLVRCLFPERASRLFDLFSKRASSDYDIRQTFSGAVSYNIPAPATQLEVDLRKLVDGFDRLCTKRAAGERRHRSEPFRSHRILRRKQRAASGSRARRAALDFESERRGRKKN